MGKVWTDASTTLAAANLNKMVSGDNTTGSNGAGIACWGAEVQWQSGTTFAVSANVGAKNIAGDLVVSWDAPSSTVIVDYSAAGHVFETSSYDPVVVASQLYTISVPYHIVVYPNAANQRLIFRFYSMGATPAVITTADTNMDFHFIVWGYLNG